MEYPSPRVDRTLSYSWIQYYTLDSPQQAYAALGCMWDKVPVLIRKSQAVKDVGGLTFDTLGVLAGTGEVDVLCSDVKKHRFIEPDREKNDPRGPYYVREFETQVLKMPVKEFVQCSRSWRKQKLHLTVCLCACICLLMGMPDKGVCDAKYRFLLCAISRQKVVREAVMSLSSSIGNKVLWREWQSMCSAMSLIGRGCMDCCRPRDFIMHGRYF